jgi:glycosyltransferase involved in cell wall biosynthesis
MCSVIALRYYLSASGNVASLHHEGGNCLKIAFLVNDLHLSGGINAILKHASGLSRIHHHDVTIVVSGRGGWHEWRYPELKDVEVRPLSSALDVEFDVAIATWWETIFNIGLLNARATVWFIQSLEDRFYTAGDPMQLLAQSAYSVNIPAITEAAWIRDFLVSLNPLRPVGYAVNGIDKAVFKPSTQRLVPSAPLKIMIEGSLSAPNKGVRQCFEVLARMEEPHEVVWVSPSGASPDGPEVMALAGPLTFEEMAEVYRQSDLLLKLSRVEGMFGPPLEAFHCGATAVVAPVTGAEEYIRHGYNSLVVAWDDIVGTARVLDRLATDAEELAMLKSGAVETASRWISWEESTTVFERELRRLSSDEHAVSSSQVRSQASVLRSLRVPMRLMHENSIATHRVALGAFERIDQLTVEIKKKDRLLKELEYVHAEKEWWDHFRRRFPVRALMKLRGVWRRMRRR